MRVTQHQDSVFLENCKFDIAGQPGYYNFQKQLHFATGNKKSEAGQTNPCLMANKMAAACLFTSFQIITAHNVHAITQYTTVCRLFVYHELHTNYQYQ